MITGTTASGFAFEIEEDALDDYDLLHALVQVDKGEVSAIFSVVELLLGPSQHEALKNHVRTSTGRVSAKRMAEEVADIFKNCREIKNS